MHLIIQRAYPADTVDYLATCSYLLKCCSVPYATERSITLLHACNTRIHVHERAGLGRISEAVHMRVYTVHVRVISACASYVGYKNDIKMCAYYELYA